MCACDRAFAEEFLTHQLARGRDLHSGLDVAVTVGFQPSVCRECRGLPPEACPKAELYGHSSKIQRYYWREIFVETTRRFATWAAEEGFADRRRARRDHKNKYDQIRQSVVDEIKAQHARSPKYVYGEVSAAVVLARYAVTIQEISAEYSTRPDGGRDIKTGDGVFDTPESAAAAHFQNEGFETLDCESRPLHVLFGVYLWLVIQDPTDPFRKLAGFGNRDDYDSGQKRKAIWTFLPKDFGRPGYAHRRAKALDEHFATLDKNLLWLFDYWLGPSSDLRQYLWAHRPDDVSRGRRLVEILPRGDLLRVLRYLADSYWARYKGWPDLIVHNKQEYFFAEVKGSRDSLSEDQKRWIEDNASMLHLPFRVVKLPRRRVQPT